MKTVIPYQTKQITRKQIIENIKANGDCCYFHMSYDWEYLSVENLNDNLDNDVEEGCLLMDVEYDPVGVDSGYIIFEVCVADVSEYLNEDNW